MNKSRTIRRRTWRKHVYQRFFALALLGCIVLLGYVFYLEGKISRFEKESILLVSPIPQEMVIQVGGRAPEKDLISTPTPTPKQEVVAPVPSNSSQKSVYDMIGEVWGEDAEIGRLIAFCESSYGVRLKNKYSSASGVFMFINGTWVEERNKMGRDENLDLKLNTRENIETAYSHFKRLGIQPWKASTHCIEE